MTLPVAPPRLSSPRLIIRLAWLAALWVGGVTVMGIVAVLLRWLMRLAGLAS